MSTRTPPAPLPRTSTGSTDLGYRLPVRRRTLARRILHLRQAASLAPSWPLVALFGCYPLWWALGLGSFAFVILAIPMALRLGRMRSIKLPPGFALWVVFLLWAIAGILMLGMNPPDTVSEPATGRILGYVMRTAQYLAATVIFLYIGNLTREQLSRERLARLLGWFCVTIVAGGLLGLLAPGLEFTSPVEALLPQSISGHGYLHTLVHPASAQVMEVLGYTSPRPQAPFEYTNTWGQMLGVTIPWLMAGWWAHGKRWQRIVAVAALLASIPPIIYSLNRGLWIALAVMIVYITVRLALRGRMMVLWIVAVTLLISTVAFMASPLRNVVEDRLAHPHSNQGRSSINTSTAQTALRSPILGFGTTRTQVGSGQSIAVGPSADCPRCGNAVMGGDGQLWLDLIAHGLVGTFFFLAFFIQAVLRYRRDITPTGMAGMLGVFLMFVFMPVYTATGMPLLMFLIAISMLWRRDMEYRSTLPPRSDRLIPRLRRPASPEAS